MSKNDIFNVVNDEYKNRGDNMRKLEKIGSEFKVIVENEENRSKTEKIYTKKELKDIHKEIVANINNIESAYSKTRKKVKELEEIKESELTELREFIELAEKVKKYNDALSAEKQIPDFKKQLDELKEQKSEIEVVITELRR